MEAVVALGHSRFHSAWADVFTKRVVADCMTHNCTMVETHHTKLDYCCQYGCDVDLFERDAILKRKSDIMKVLSPAAQALPWFDESEPHQDPDVPSGTVVRTAVLDNGCLFLSHDARGCAIHRASLEQGWDFRGTKPSICRLFPLSYEDNTICISDDYKDYSCAYTADSPTLYRVGRDALGDIFGADLVAAMDAAEEKILSRRLPQVR